MRNPTFPFCTRPLMTQQGLHGRESHNSDCYLQSLCCCSFFSALAFNKKKKKRLGDTCTHGIKLKSFQACSQKHASHPRCGSIQSSSAQTTTLFHQVLLQPSFQRNIMHIQAQMYISTTPPLYTNGQIPNSFLDLHFFISHACWRTFHVIIMRAKARVLVMPLF